MDFLSFLWNLQTAGSYGEALFQSVITHYNTFIHTGCKVPWALRGLLRRGDAVAEATFADQGEMSATFLMVSPSALSRFAKLTLADGGSENRIFHCHRNSPNKGNELFLSRAFHDLLLCTYVPAIGFTRPSAIPPECHPVRTYTANFRRTHLYEVLPQLPHP